MAEHAEVFENPSSTYPGGKRARELLEHARGGVATLVGSLPEEVIFTGSGTEAINTALWGVCLGQPGLRTHVITSTIEHAAMLSTCRRLEQFGVEVDYVSVGGDGIVDPDDIRRAVRPHTKLIAVMHANNEIGTVQPIRDIARVAADAGATFLTDAVQTAGKIPLETTAAGIDLMAISAHKFHGPKGVGALIRRRETHLTPLITGGGQESGLRSGTENLVGAAGMAAAAAEALRDLESKGEYVRVLRQRLYEGLLALGDVRVNGSLAHALPGTLNVSFRFVKGDALAAALAFEGIAVSTGSACHAKEAKPSHVLVALGLGPEWLTGGVRFSLGAENTVAQVDYVIGCVALALRRLRAMSPLARQHASMPPPALSAKAAVNASI
jgi:cysteine desulfurase